MSDLVHRLRLRAKPSRTDVPHDVHVLLPEAADRIAELEGLLRERRASPWVSVKTSLPEPDVFVLWMHESGNVCQEMIDHLVSSERTNLEVVQNCGLKYWMPIPEAPND